MFFAWFIIFYHILNLLLHIIVIPRLAFLAHIVFPRWDQPLIKVSISDQNIIEGYPFHGFKSKRNVASIDSFEVIFNHFLTYIGQCLSQSYLRTKERTKQWLFLDLMASLQLLEDSQKFLKIAVHKPSHFCSRFWSFLCFVR